jgi:uncharacterized membrane protein
LNYISLNPIGPWPIVAIAAAAVTVLTIWAYRQRLRGSTGMWRWVALSLRLAAVLLCLLAALRPSVNWPEKKKQPASVVFLIDISKSMQIGDEINSQTRWQVARKALDDAVKAVTERSKDLEIKIYQFDKELREEKIDDKTVPAGRESSLGSSLVEGVRRQTGTSVAAVVLISDGASNAGTAPLVAADQLKLRLIPVMTVGVGDENAGAGSRDVAIRDFTIGPTVFVKNQPEIRGTISARGFANTPIEVEMIVEGEGTVATIKVTPKTGADVIPITGLKYLPQTSGEKRVSLKVKQQSGELVQANNEFSTYLNVLRGGVRVLYIQGPNFTWEYNFLSRSLDAAKEVHVDFKVIRQPASGDRGLLDDADLSKGNYDVIILGDIAAEYLTPRQHLLIAKAVEGGAGLVMLGGRTSFGLGGWSNTDLAGVVPFVMHPGDGQMEPPNGLKFEPNPMGLQSYILRLAPTPEESRKLWESLPNMNGANRFGTPKPLATVLATVQGTREPLMISMETGRGRVLAFGGETWNWYRADERGLLAHRRFWRQAILWSAHKEDKGDNEVKLKLDSRRVAVGQKLDMTATARDPKREPIRDVQYETTVTRIASPDGAKAEGAKPEPVQLYNQVDEAKGFYTAAGVTGQYLVETVGKRNGQQVGSDTARFDVYEDDREFENPAADRTLLRQIAEITAGKSVTPEELGKTLASLDTTATERVSLTEKRIWDNWYFFLIFATLLTLEWWLRKRKGWV